MAYHPVYQPAATILPGNTSYRVVTPTGSEDGFKDDSSDQELDTRAYARKIEREIGLGEPTDAETAADRPVLLQKPLAPRDAIDRHNTNLDKLRKHLVDVQRSERFTSNRFGTPPSISGSTAGGQSVSYRIQNGLPIDTSSQFHPIHRDDVYHSKYHALPFEKPVETVYVHKTPEEVDALIRGAIEKDRALAEKARGTVIGGGVETSGGQMAIFEDDGVMSEGSINTVEPLGDPRSRESTMS